MLAKALKRLVAIAILRPSRSEIKQHYLRFATLSILATVLKHLVGMASFEFCSTKFSGELPFYQSLQRLEKMDKCFTKLPLN